jgi:hypothetical protein
LQSLCCSCAPQTTAVWFLCLVLPLISSSVCGQSQVAEKVAEHDTTASPLFHVGGDVTAPKAIFEIPTPRPVLYKYIQDYRDWKNFYLTVLPDGIAIECLATGFTKKVPVGALHQTLLSLPLSAWRYGRVVAVQVGGGPTRPDAPRRIEQNRVQADAILKAAPFDCAGLGCRPGSVSFWGVSNRAVTHWQESMSAISGYVQCSNRCGVEVERGSTLGHQSDQITSNHIPVNVFR